MHKITKKIAKKMNLPPWWVEAIAIEHTECRDYATRDEIWTFNFDKLSEKDIEEAVESHNVVVCGTVFHNVHKAVYSHRLIDRLTSDISLALVEETDDLIVEGQASDYHFLFLGNPIDVWDPKLNFSSHLQVLDEGKIWQWRIAKFVSVEGRKYGKWISSDVDLEPLDKIHDKLALLRNNIIKPGRRGHKEFKDKVKELYHWIDRIRRPILSKLEQVHKSRKAKSLKSKTIIHPPPLISRFEKFTIIDNKIYTKFLAETIFFRSCVQHSRKAEELISNLKTDREIVNKLDEIYQERAISIILATACLEAFLNGLGFEHLPKIWKKIERLSLETKWQLFSTLKGKKNLFDAGREPYQSLGKLVNYRNSLIHFKPQYNEIRKEREKTISYTEFKLPRKFVYDLPKIIKELIRELCEAMNLPIPPWTNLQADWLLERK